MSTLWDKGYEVDRTIHRFTVGRDPELDMGLIPADCLGTMAHVEGLRSAGLLDAAERDRIREGLDELLEEYEAGRFRIDPAQEDGHTAIEAFLTERLGETGEKVHTGRSRNDQVMTALRLYGRGFLVELAERTVGLVESLLSFAERYQHVPMPGRTHLQKAMLSSLGLWGGAYAEQLLDDLSMADRIYDLLDRSPLGSAAGYGVPLPLDREYTAELLGFASVQNNVLAAANSRGKAESYVVDVLEQISLTLSKLAEDLMLFALPEFGYFTLPDSLCTGSSIMPQKKNPDGLELVRGNTGVMHGYAAGIKSTLSALPAGYNRDLQLTKEPFMRACELSLQMVEVMRVTMDSLEVHEGTLREAVTPELFATDRALELVRQGVPFREAYRRVAAQDASGERDRHELEKAFAARGSAGGVGNLALHSTRQASEELAQRFRRRGERANRALRALFDRDVRVFRPVQESC